MKDEGVRTKIFDWRVPMSVAGAPVAAVGTLEWVPADVFRQRHRAAAWR